MSRLADRALGGARHLPVGVLVALYVLRFGLLSVQVYDGYASPGYDLGIFDQGVWLLSRFHAPFVTVMGRNLFGDHTSFVLLLAVPLYWLAPHPQTLLVLQTVLLAAGAVPVYLLALRRLGSVWMATAVAGAYLLDPALQGANMEQFHPEAFAVPLIGVAVLAAVENRRRLLILAVVGILLVKEDAALVVLPLALWVGLRRDRRLGVALAAGACAWTAVAYEAVIRPLLGTDSFYGGRIPFGGLGGLVTAPLTRPGRFFSYLLSSGRPGYAWQIGASFGWVFLLAPSLAAVGALVFAENYLSTFPYMHEIGYHYSLPVVAALAAGSAWAIGRIGPNGRRSAATALCAGSALAACVVWGSAPFSLDPVYPHQPPGGPAVAAENRALRAVPPDAVVSASSDYVAHLDHRLRIYQWPTPFVARFWGLYRQEGRPLPFASQVEFLVIPSRPGPYDQAVLRSVAPRFRPVASGGGVTVWERLPEQVLGVGADDLGPDR